eukprot:scaffold89931_cov41-Attheya_sp.AAC.2
MTRSSRDKFGGKSGEIAIGFSAACPFLAATKNEQGRVGSIASILNSILSLFDLLPPQRSTQQGTSESRKATTIQYHIRFQVKISSFIKVTGWESNQPTIQHQSRVKRASIENKMPTRVTFRVKRGSSLPVNERAKKQRATNVPRIRVKSEIVTTVEEVVTVKTEEIDDGSTGESFLDIQKTAPYNSKSYQ